MVNVALRRYGPADARSTWQLFHAAVRGTARQDYTADQVAAWAPDEPDLDAWDAARAAAWTVVAADRGCVVGFCDLTDDGHLDMLFVHPDHGLRGVARVLVMSVLDEARRRGLSQVHTRASITARPAFERFGFVVERENPDHCVRGRRFTNYDMRRVL